MYAMAISNSFLSENSISEPGMKRMENIIYPLGAWVVQLSCLCIILLLLLFLLSIFFAIVCGSIEHCCATSFDVFAYSHLLVYWLVHSR